jgi:ubiquinone/menaquinone biosynthesis C-methylase UbiE
MPSTTRLLHPARAGLLSRAARQGLTPRTPSQAQSASAGSGPSARPPRSKPLSRATPALSPDAVAEPRATTTAPPPSFNLACPICLTTPLPVSHAGRGTLKPARCGRCARTFDAAPDFLDLTLESGVSSPSTSSSPSSPSSLGTSIFRSPLVAFAYDRGWRAGFAWAGFPGPDEEAAAALAYLKPAAQGEVVLDLSCGSGLFARRFAASGAFAGVIAADFSEAMLREAAGGLAADGVDPATYLPLRLDAARLPFPAGALAGVHAGAALHCWPAPGAAVAEISRVLRPGGVFVGSTFLDAAAPLGSLIGDDAASALASVVPGAVGGSMPAGRAFRWWSEREIRALCSAAGLVDFKRWRKNRFILWSATKPAHDPGFLEK